MPSAPSCADWLLMSAWAAPPANRARRTQTPRRTTRIRRRRCQQRWPAPSPGSGRPGWPRTVGTSWSTSSAERSKQPARRRPDGPGTCCGPAPTWPPGSTTSAAQCASTPCSTAPPSKRSSPSSTKVGRRSARWPRWPPTSTLCGKRTACPSKWSAAASGAAQPRPPTTLRRWMPSSVRRPASRVRVGADTPMPPWSSCSGQGRGPAPAGGCHRCRSSKRTGSSWCAACSPNDGTTGSTTTKTSWRPPSGSTREQSLRSVSAVSSPSTATPKRSSPPGRPPSQPATGCSSVAPPAGGAAGSPS